MRLKRKHLLIFSIALSICVAVVGIGTALFLNTWKVTDKISTQRTDSQCLRFNRQNLTSNIYVFTYEVDAKRYDMRDCGSSPNVTTISYNPSNPSHAVLNTPLLYQVPGALFGGLGVLAALGVLFTTRSKKDN